MKEIYIAEDGTEFIDKDACLAYEQSSTTILPDKFPDLYIKDLDGFYPILSKRSASNDKYIYSYQWFKLNDKNDWIHLANSFSKSLAFVMPRNFPEVVALEVRRPRQFSSIEKASYTGAYYYYHSDNRVIDLWRKLIEVYF